jgi:retron-type reverse transcriptase
MVRLEKLKAATTRQDVADILGFQLKSLTYILYKQTPAEKYRTFEIPKRTGGMRTISAPTPELKKLQRRLAELLESCVDSINSGKAKTGSLSHGFKPGHSIFTNAVRHRRRRFVFNVDLENFFGSINFGRVRGFFMHNKNFLLKPDVATVLAQIACHENTLPQGSPCSPIISNLVGHILDIRLVQLASRTGCTYSRYADDITFSTNKSTFPIDVAGESGEVMNWTVGAELAKTIRKTGFSVNEKKTRMQLAQSRQDVTGLVVNRRVNIRSEYRHLARAMVHRLIRTGAFQTKSLSKKEDGSYEVKEIDGNVKQLGGMLSYIDSSHVFNRKRAMPELESVKPLHPPEKLNRDEQIYKKFLFYSNFFNPASPTVVFEGKTDNIYLKCAIRELANEYPALATLSDKGKVKIDIRLFERTQTSDRLLEIPGGTSQIKDLIKEYFRQAKGFKDPVTTHPTVFLIDNDDGAVGLYKYAKSLGAIGDKNSPYLHLGKNLYLVPTPLTADGKDTMIEDFFEDSVLKKELNGKRFNPKNTGHDTKTDFGKAYFAQHIVKKDEKSINFDKFKSILDRIQLVIDTHKKTGLASLAAKEQSAGMIK